MSRKMFLAATWLSLLWSCAFAAEPLRLVSYAYPPYVEQTQNGAQGLSVDIVKEAFARMQRPVLIEFYPFARGVKMISEGVADGLFTIKKTPERTASMLFPQRPLFSQDYVFFTLKNSGFHFDGHFSSIADARIGVVNATHYGDRFGDAVKSGEFKHLDSASDYELTFRKLLGKRVDAVICSRLVGLAILKNMGAADKTRISGPPTESAVSYLAFSRARVHPDVAVEFDRAIESMEKDDTIKKFFLNYHFPNQAGVQR